MNINEKTYLSIEELISLPTLSDINISDDGKNVAFVKKTADWKIINIGITYGYMKKIMVNVTH